MVIISRNSFKIKMIENTVKFSYLKVYYFLSFNVFVWQFNKLRFY